MKNVLVLLAVATLGLASCSDKNTDKLVTIHTEMGDMTVLLYEETPLHKANFIEVAESGKFDSTVFHRVMNEFMIQGGDIFRKQGNPRADTTKLEPEIVEKFFHKKGELAAARQPDRVNPLKKSSSCQFYIVHGRTWTEQELIVDQLKLNQTLSQMFQTGEYDSLREQFVNLQLAGDVDGMNALAMEKLEYVESEMGVNLRKDISQEQLEAYTTVGGAPFLDGEYTVFGRVVEGMDVIDKVAVVPVKPGNEPITPVYLTTSVKKMSKEDITKKYGYVYPSK